MLHSVGMTSRRYTITPRILRALYSRRRTVLCFDDGYEDVFDHIQKMPGNSQGRAAVFVVTSHVGRTNTWDTSGELAGRQLLTWGQIIELSKKGLTIGSHSCTHSDLRSLSERDLGRELGDSKREIEDRTGKAVAGFSYPFGFWDKRVIGAVAQQGYKWAVTTSDSIWEGQGNPYRLRRIEIKGTDPAWLVRLKASALYDAKALWELPRLVFEKIAATKRR